MHTSVIWCLPSPCLAYYLYLEEVMLKVLQLIISVHSSCPHPKITCSTNNLVYTVIWIVHQSWREEILERMNCNYAKWGKDSVWNLFYYRHFINICHCSIFLRISCTKLQCKFFNKKVFQNTLSCITCSNIFPSLSPDIHNRQLHMLQVRNQRDTRKSGNYAAFTLMFIK